MTTDALEALKEAARLVVRARDDWPEFLPIPVHNAITELSDALREVGCDSPSEQELT